MLFKLVKIVNKEKYSLNFKTGANNFGCIKYNLPWNYPPPIFWGHGYYITTFNTEQNVLKYYKRNKNVLSKQNIQLFSVTCQFSSIIKLPPLLPPQAFISKAWFLAKSQAALNGQKFGEWPEGTVMCPCIHFEENLGKL